MFHKEDWSTLSRLFFTYIPVVLAHSDSDYPMLELVS